MGNIRKRGDACNMRWFYLFPKRKSDCIKYCNRTFYRLYCFTDDRNNILFYGKTAHFDHCESNLERYLYESIADTYLYR